MGALIALYERAVGFYGVAGEHQRVSSARSRSGKKAATRLLELQGRVLPKVSAAPGKTAEEIARVADADPEDVFHALHHAAVNDPSIRITPADRPADEKFYREK